MYHLSLEGGRVLVSSVVTVCDYHLPGTLLVKVRTLAKLVHCSHSYCVDTPHVTISSTRVKIATPISCGPHIQRSQSTSSLVEMYST